VHVLPLHDIFEVGSTDVTPAALVYGGKWAARDFA
jgi:hypothetical protein